MFNPLKTEIFTFGMQVALWRLERTTIVQDKGKIMNLPLLPFLRLLVIQAGLTLLMAIPFYTAQAEDTITVKQQINTYLYQGESIDLADEMELDQEDKVVKIDIKAQAIENNAKLALIVNGERIKTANLTDQLKDIQFKIAKNKKLEKLEIKSQGAFVRFAKAELVSDEPMDDDLSRSVNTTRRASIFARLFGSN